MDAEQLFTLGYNYRHGIGVEKDEKKAFEYYMKAAELGNSDAMQNVSNCYYYGNGVERNYQKSFEYCKR
ncbi:SEL1 protein [Gigaspora margarita]|uniref:SEL1 protein n=1 Tax=Gigaspora margarita TaxID=4874 RepID=A0A8H4EI23_GIGMA|nr:SEL1 protein [Gigaspora margarita]